MRMNSELVERSCNSNAGVLSQTSSQWRCMISIVLRETNAGCGLIAASLT